LTDRAVIAKTIDERMRSKILIDELLREQEILSSRGIAWNAGPAGPGPIPREPLASGCTPVQCPEESVNLACLPNRS
jgi:hypothetical protein